MIRLLRRALRGLVLLGTLAVIVGSLCQEVVEPAITPEKLQAQVQPLGDALCALYAERGVTPPPGPNGSFVCPYPPGP